MDKTIAIILTAIMLAPLVIGILESIIETIKKVNSNNIMYSKKRKHELEIEELNRQIKEEYDNRH